MPSVMIQGPKLSAEVIARLRPLVGATVQTNVSPTSVRLERLRGPISDEAIALALAEKLDITVVRRPMEAREFRLLAMDMDSTLITIECIDELADLAGVKTTVEAITTAAMRGELDFAGALRQRVALLEGLEAGALERVYFERLKLSPGADVLLKFAQLSGWKTLLVSGGFTFFTDRLKARLGLDYTLANTLEVRDGRLTGRVCGSIIDGDAKAAEVKRVCELMGCPTTAAIVAGDGANDLKMMALAGWSVAYRAKPRVQVQADMAINHSGLDAVVDLFRPVDTDPTHTAPQL